MKSLTATCVLALALSSPVAAIADDSGSAMAGEFGERIIEELALHADSEESFSPDQEFLVRLADRVGAQPASLDDLSIPRAAIRATDNEIRVGDQARLILAEIELARRIFDPQGEANRLLKGLVYLEAAKAQADFALVHMTRSDGSFANTAWAEGTFTETSSAEAIDQALMLEAFSILTDTIATEGEFASAYGDRQFVGWFAAGAQQAYLTVSEIEPDGVVGLHAQIRALSAYRSVTDDAQAVDDLIDRYAKSLAEASVAAPEEAAMVTDALLRVEGYERDALRWADRLLEYMAEADSWSLSTLGTAVSTLGMLANQPDWDRHGEAEELLRVRLEEMLPALQGGSDGDIGRLPAAIEHNGDGWQPGDSSATLAVALDLARGLLAYGHATTPPAQVKVPALDAGPQMITLAAKEFSFSPSSTEFVGGHEVTIRLENSGLIPHNIRIDGLDVFVEAEPGGVAEVTFVAPDTPGSFSYICDIPGHADGGMVGEFVVLPASAGSDQASTGSPMGSESFNIVTAATIDDPAEHAAPSLSSAEPAGSLIDGPFSLTSLVLAIGFVVAMLIFVAGLLNFTRYAESQK
ncbi:MAG: cupredoxin domain-containing protein [Acidimicrobiia bacterium]|nr:cupredoxin domain-containing protein [Acidimicrobiia bacterium]MDH5503015.1 cupredoxin domain-containing protein [Acidimicrobiia bacterium]